MKVSEIMSRHPVTITPTESIRKAAEIMSRIDAGFVPVGENDRLVGMITDRDIAIRGVAEGKGPDTPISDAMTSDVRFCYEDEDTEAVCKNMGEQQIRRLPVVDREKRLVGILSLGDLAVRGDGGLAATGALEEIAQPGGPHS